MSDSNTPKYEMHIPEGYNKIHHRHLGPILAVLVVLLVLILGGLYLWGGLLFKEAVIPPPIVNDEPETPRAVADAQILEVLSPSDELDAIDADLGSTNLDSLDSDLVSAEAELETALR